MRFLFTIAAAFSIVTLPGYGSDVSTFLDFWNNPKVKLDLSSAGPNQLELRSAAADAFGIEVEVPAGLICSTPDRQTRCVVIKSVNGALTMKLAIPILLLSTDSTTPRQWTPTNESVPELAPFLKYLAANPTVSTGAAQLTLFCLLHNFTYRQWLAFGVPAGAAAPGAEKLSSALDAIAILRAIEPGRSFALLTDNELKMRALQTPGLRGKAMQVYNMKLPGMQSVDPKTLPSIGQLLHTAPGDNCPICRQRGDSDRLQNNL